MLTELLNPRYSAVVLIDHQPQMDFGVAGIDRQALFNNVLLLARAARSFKVPTILTTVETKCCFCNLWPQLLDIFPDQVPVERTSMNTSVTTDNAVMCRIEQAGGAPVTALEKLLEYQRDWARKETDNEGIEVVKEYGGTYGQGVEHASTMVHGAPASRARNGAGATRVAGYNPWLSGDDGSKGPIAAERQADLAVLSVDCFTVPEEGIKDIESEWTIMGGRVVHDLTGLELFAQADRASEAVQ